MASTESFDQDRDNPVFRGLIPIEGSGAMYPRAGEPLSHPAAAQPEQNSATPTAYYTDAEGNRYDEYGRPMSAGDGSGGGDGGTGGSNGGGTGNPGAGSGDGGDPNPQVQDNFVDQVISALSDGTGLPMVDGPGLPIAGAGLPIVDGVVNAVTQTVGQATGSGGLLTLPDLAGLINDNGIDLGDIAGRPGDVIQGVLSGIGDGSLVPDVGDVLNPIVSQVTGITGDGAINTDGLLGTVGDTAGGLVDTVLAETVGDNSLGGSVLGAIGDDIVGATVGGDGLLAGTPIAGAVGDGSLVSTGIMQGDDSSASGLLQVAAGNDPSRGLLNVDAASDDDASKSNHIVDAQAGPQTSGNELETDLLGASRDSSGTLVDAGIGQHYGPSLVGVNALTAAESFQFPAMDGVGLNSLVGTIGGLPDGGGTSTGLLPVSVGLDGTAVADIGGDALVSLGDHSVQPGTDLTLNTPLHV